MILHKTELKILVKEVDSGVGEDYGGHNMQEHIHALTNQKEELYPGSGL